MKDAAIIAVAIAGGVGFLVWFMVSAMRAIVREPERRGGDISGFCSLRLCQMSEAEREALDAKFAEWPGPRPARDFPIEVRALPFLPVDHVGGNDENSIRWH